MSHNDYASRIAQSLGISSRQVSATIGLLDEGCTVPFISRYRKEATHGLDEVQVEQVRLANIMYVELLKRRAYVLDTIREQGKLHAELEQQIGNCWDPSQLEDIYLPYKPKRKTLATVAREKGLEPLAGWLLQELNADVEAEASAYLNDKVPGVKEALEGARDIIAEMYNEQAQVRDMVRRQFEKHAVLYSKVGRGKAEEGAKYRDYYAFSEPLARCPSHRLLAMFRGEDEGFLRLNIKPDDERTLEQLNRMLLKRSTGASRQLKLAIDDAWDRLLAPSMENEFRARAKAKADAEAIQVFAENLRQLLLSAPLGGKRMLSIDPGFRSGCKVVCLDESGQLLADEIIYPHEPQKEISAAITKLKQLLKQHACEAIAIGNGTAGRETEDLVRSITFERQPEIYMVNENGASIYSASEIAREEFPDKDVTVRGAVSIGRRLADPLAELVKIDPKSIGVGQYQHDVDQVKLKQTLQTVVQSCVNSVGVNLNTASKSLLTYVSGLGPQLAQNIVQYRNENGAFSSRAQLKKVSRLGEKAFEQCAAFLRIPGAKNPLDNSAVHPESYDLVQQIAKVKACTVQQLVADASLRKSIEPAQFVSPAAGLPTIMDILKELEKPGRDPREQLKPFTFAGIKSAEELQPGMVLPGIVTNITRFGCFVDIGVKQDGMVHISQLADRYVSDPAQVVKLQQQIKVKVLEVDLPRKRISLSMKDI